MMETESSIFSRGARLEDGLVIWELSGSLRQDTVDDYKAVLKRIVEAGHHRIVFDFEGLNAVDSLGIGFFVSALREVRARKGRLVLARLDAKFAALFELTLLNRIFEMFTDLETAKKSFGPIQEEKE